MPTIGRNIRRRWDAPSNGKIGGEDKALGYVEMGELPTEFWASIRDGDVDGRICKVRPSRKVTDLYSWLQCYAIYMVVLGPPELQAIPELIVYMAFIIRVSQEYEGLGWFRYNSAFRWQAVLSRNKRWSVINSTLFSMNSTVRPLAVRHCKLCFATTHSERDRAQYEEPRPRCGQASAEPGDGGTRNGKAQTDSLGASPPWKTVGGGL